MASCRAMEITVSSLVILHLMSFHLVVAEESPTLAFVWSDLRCVGVQDQSLNLESQSFESLLETLFIDFEKCSVTRGLSEEKAKPEIIVAFFGKELRCKDISHGHASGIPETLQELVTGAKYSSSIPYVPTESDKATIVEYLISNFRKASLNMGRVASSESCFVDRHDVKKLTDVSDIQVFISDRKTSRMQGETDILVICHGLALDSDLAAIATLEDEVLSIVKSSSISNIAMYFTDLTMGIENRSAILNRHLFQVNGTAIPDCDALCRSRAVILEGISVVIFFVVVLVAGLCCMKGVKAPARYEVSKEQ